MTFQVPPYALAGTSPTAVYWSGQRMLRQAAREIRRHYAWARPADPLGRLSYDGKMETIRDALHAIEAACDALDAKGVACRWHPPHARKESA